MAIKLLSQVALTASLALLGTAAPAQSNPYEKGPVPTLASIQADGPFTIASQTIPSGSGFGGATVYTPTAPGTYAVVAVCTGFVTAQSSMAPMAKRLATHGFVVVNIDTNTIFDFPDSRATQLLAALKAAVALKTGPVAGKIDVSRQAVAGWSMGGGGTLLAANSTPGLKGAVAFAPWVAGTPISADRVPSAIVGGASDNVAPAASHSTPLYNSIPASTPKLLGIITGASHFFPTTTSQPASYTSIAWMKRFVDNDTRYSGFLNGDAAYSSFSSNGPF